MTDEQAKQLKELRKIEWWEMMRLKHPGKTDEEIKDVMREYGKRNTGETSWLKDNPDKAREIASKKRDYRTQARKHDEMVLAQAKRKK